MQVIALLLSLSVLSQSSNDECFTARNIPDIDDFCSMGNLFSNLEATASTDQMPSCWRQDAEQSDIWYSFAPKEPGVFIQIFGEGDNSEFTLKDYSIAVYDGTCTNLNLLLCSDAPSSTNLIERTLTDLIIGRIYYLRVSSSTENQGSFQLCLDQFKPVPSPEQDCDKAVVLCDKSSFVVEFLQGGGDDIDEAAFSCLGTGGPSESSSAWYKWTARTNGTLTFTLTPNNDRDPEEDLDFAVYQLPNGLDDCDNKELLRCMASGETQGQTFEQNAPCFGPTGLNIESVDTVELPGCFFGDDNFLAALDMVAGESYALIVNNFSRSGLGFTIDFGGSGEFLGPEPDFGIMAQQAFECDKSIFFDDMSVSATDQIISYNWNFGEGANPLFAAGNERHEVVYESFGEKLVALTVETSQGCQVTKILELNIDPCCDDISTLEALAEKTDVLCFGESNGSINVSADLGTPEYLYSDNGVDFQPSPVFSDLSAGTYSVFVQDRKGCEAETEVTILEPSPIELEVFSLVDSVDLGFGTELFITEGAPERTISYMWSPPEGLTCSDCPEPGVIPPGTTTYTLTVTDVDGCMTSSDVTIFTRFTRPFYAPTAISPGAINGNQFFRIFGNQAIEIVELLEVYDRWGGLMYSRSFFDIDDPAFFGWNGTINGKSVNPGVFTWVAKVRFVDNVTINYSGSFVVVD